MKDVRITHIGGPTVLIEVHGWRLLTDPTFDVPGRRYTFAAAPHIRRLLCWLPIGIGIDSPTGGN